MKRHKGRKYLEVIYQIRNFFPAYIKNSNNPRTKRQCNSKMGKESEYKMAGHGGSHL
jgi:hypothetical protein